MPHHTRFIERDCMIPMRDGVRLATDIHRPADTTGPLPGPFPVVLLRTPYDKSLREAGYAAQFVEHGYVVVIQDLRGRYSSEGRWRLLERDTLDGHDTAAWILKQPWCSGKICTVGGSYEGGTQHALALGNAPGIAAMVPVYAVSNPGSFGMRHNGAFELRFFNWTFALGDPTGMANTRKAPRAAAVPEAAPALAALTDHSIDYVHALPLRRGMTPLRYAPDYEDWIVEAMEHGANDEFWQGMGVDVERCAEEHLDVPVLHVTGWYDSWTHQVANMNFRALNAKKKSLQRLIVGPWTHTVPETPVAGDAEFSADAVLDIRATERRWFDRWAKGEDNGIDREAPVRIYVMGGGDGHKTATGRIYVGGHWRDESEWPPARCKPTPYYLHADGLLSPQQAARGQTTYRFDPADPVPTLGGNLSSQGNFATAGVMDQRGRPGLGPYRERIQLSARNDIVVFRTPLLEKDMEITGRLIVKLWASTDGLDTDFTVKLIDEYPPNRDYPTGYDLNISDGIMRARFRNGREELLEPGKPYEFTIEIYPTSLLLPRGHRLRLDISSSNFPRFDINPNTGEPLNRNRLTRVATNTIYFGHEHPSHVVLPVMP